LALYSALAPRCLLGLAQQPADEAEDGEKMVGATGIEPVTPPSPLPSIRLYAP
jgi:hypothetical protein